MRRNAPANLLVERNGGIGAVLTGIGLDTKQISGRMRRHFQQKMPTVFSVNLEFFEDYLVLINMAQILNMEEKFLSVLSQRIAMDGFVLFEFAKEIFY